MGTSTIGTDNWITPPGVKQFKVLFPIMGNIFDLFMNIREFQAVRLVNTSIVGIVVAKKVGDTRLGSGDEISGQCRRS